MPTRWSPASRERCTPHSPTGRPPPEADAEDAGDSEPEPIAEHLSESTEDAQIILVADTDVLADRFWVVVEEFLGTRIAVPSAANGAFVVNALDNLTGSGDLISVRNRGTFTRPFTRVDCPQAAGRARLPGKGSRS